MPTKLRIRVTREVLQRAAYCGHIKENGKYIMTDDEAVQVSTNCAIALALRDIFPMAVVGPDIIVPFGDDIYSHCFSEIDLPEEAQVFIRDFDNLMPAERKKMQPFAFDIEVPDDVIKHAFPIAEDLAEIFRGGRENLSF